MNNVLSRVSVISAEDQMFYFAGTIVGPNLRSLDALHVVVAMQIGADAMIPMTPASRMRRQLSAYELWNRGDETDRIRCRAPGSRGRIYASLLSDLCPSVSTAQLPSKRRSGW